MAPILEVELFHQESGLSHVAVVRTVNIPQDVLSWYVCWLPEMFDLAGRPTCPDSQWDVPKMWDISSKRSDTKVLVIDCEDDIQGYSVIKMKNHIGIDGKPCTNVKFLAVAPWNRSGKGGDCIYVGTGKLLLACSIIVGAMENGSAALELDSLPTAEAFYRKQGMVPTGNKSKEGLLQYRFDEKTAQSYITNQMKNKIRVWRK